MSKPVIPHTLDDYFKTTPIGSVDKAISENLYGINHRQTIGLVPSNKDMYGYTFITRPQLNLQDDNILNIRFFYSLLSEQVNSMQRFVRCTLDPRIQNGYTFKPRGNAKGFTNPSKICHIVDPFQAFIPVLSNNLNSVSGWPDITLPTFDSKKGLYNEVYSQADGISRNYESFDLDLSFRNTRGDPILFLFYIWIHYSSLVFEGKIVPYPDFIVENRIDYNTRIYRLVMDSTKKVVKKITATGVAFPISVPTGSFFDYSNEKPFNDQNKDITIRFRCLGTDYLDDILVREFNEAVAIFNPLMKEDYLNSSQSPMIKVPENLLTLFNNRGYAHIDRNTYELNWYVHQDTFQKSVQGFKNIVSSDINSLGLGLDYSETGSTINGE